MDIVLTPTSANCLHKVPELDTWIVGPTMQKAGKKPEKPTTSLRVRQISGKFAARKQPKVKFTGTEPVEEEELEWKRTKACRTRMSVVLDELNGLDRAGWPQNPCFDPTTGTLRMKFEGASNISLGQFTAFGPEAIEVMFSHQRKASLYNESVGRLVEQVRQQLSKGTRQGFMKLVREVGEWILLQTKH